MKTIKKLNLKPKKFRIPKPKQKMNTNLHTFMPGGMPIDYDALNNRKHRG